MKSLGNPPCKNPLEEVVNGGMQISTAAIKQPDQSGVDMPNLVGA